MADAPSGGSGWSAVEVIIALILGIGLITTLTGGTIQPIFGTPAGTTKKSTAVTGKTTTATGCSIVVSRPKAKEKVTTSVAVSGSFPDCMSNSTIPDTINAQVVDSKGTSLSVYTAIPVNKGFFGLGSSTFNANIALTGVAQSTTGFLILTTPTRADGSVISTRIAIQFAPGATITNPTGATGDSYFVPNPNPTTQTNTNTGGYIETNPNANNGSTYTPPVTNPTNPDTGSGGTTF